MNYYMNLLKTGWVMFFSIEIFTDRLFLIFLNFTSFSFNKVFCWQSMYYYSKRYQNRNKAVFGNNLIILNNDQIMGVYDYIIYKI